MYTILYVDDEADLLEIAQMYLEETGHFSVDTTLSARDAQKMMNAKKYDAVIADYLMPVIDGITFLKYTRETYGDIPFILFTGKGREEVVIEAINNGADYYLQKGGDPDSLFAELIHKLHQAIRLRRDQETLRINEERLRKAQILGHTGAWEYNCVTEKIWVSDEMFRIFGISSSPSGDVAEAIESCIPDRARVHQAFLDLVSEGREYNLEYTINPADGSGEKIIHAVAEREKDRDANPLRIAGIIQDITAQYRMESALHESERKYRTLTENSLVGLGIADGIKILYVNNTLLRMYGFESREEFQKCSILDNLTTRSRETVLGLMEQRERGIVLPDRNELDIIRKDGVIRTLEYNVSPIHYDRKLCDQITFIDITERKKAEEEVRRTVEEITRHSNMEEALRKSEATFQSLVEQLQDSVIIVSFTGEILFANPSAFQLVSRVPGQLEPGMNIFSFIDPESSARVQEDLGIIADGGSTNPSEFKITTTQGKPRWVEASGIQISYLEGNAILVTIRDITERRESLDELAAMTKKLHLLSSVTRHDILNKITVILANIHVAKKKRPDPENLVFLEKLESSTKAIRDQIEFARIYENLGNNAPQWQNISRIVSRLAVPPGIRLENDTDDVEVFADPMFEKVFYNLIDNSIRYGESVSAIRLHYENHLDGITILYEDNGIGIPPEDKERIFERGYGKNTGLGLFLSHEILTLTGIAIRECGIFRKGARFELAVPRDHYRLVQEPGNNPE